MEPAAAAGRRLTVRTFGVLMTGALIGMLGVLPYALTLQGPLLDDLAAELPPLWLLLPLQVLQSLLLVAGATAVGLRLGPSVGLGAPMLRGLLAGDPQARSGLRALVLPSAALGVATALVIVGLDAGVFAPRMPVAAEELAAVRPPAWQGLLASFYGGIVEELLLRLGLMTLLVWVGTRLTRRTTPGRAVLVVAVGLAALVFAAGHLPATAAVLPLTPLVVVRALLLNAVGGVAFGWLYATRGLLAAMLAHFCADLVLHVIAPLLSP